MSKVSRFKYGVANCRGTALTKAANYSITEANILRDGYTFFKINGAYTLTLPAASEALKGVSVYVASNNASGKVAVAAGFGGGGASYDTVTVGAYNTVEFWCNGSYWYALSNAVAAS
jgi:hypothetical protein